MPVTLNLPTIPVTSRAREMRDLEMQRLRQEAEARDLNLAETKRRQEDEIRSSTIGKLALKGVSTGTSPVQFGEVTIQVPSGSFVGRNDLSPEELAKAREMKLLTPATESMDLFAVDTTHDAYGRAKSLLLAELTGAQAKTAEQQRTAYATDLTRQAAEAYARGDTARAEKLFATAQTASGTASPAEAELNTIKARAMGGVIKFVADAAVKGHITTATGEEIPIDSINTSQGAYSLANHVSRGLTAEEAGRKVFAEAADRLEKTKLLMAGAKKPEERAAIMESWEDPLRMGFASLPDSELVRIGAEFGVPTKGLDKGRMVGELSNYFTRMNFADEFEGVRQPTGWRAKWAALVGRVTGTGMVTAVKQGETREDVLRRSQDILSGRRQ